MGKVSYGKMVIIGAGNVGSAILNSVLRMNILDNIVVVNRNQKKALGEVLDASHTTAFAYSANADIRVGGYEECADAQIIVITAGPSIQPGNSRDRMVLSGEKRQRYERYYGADYSIYAGGNYYCCI